jgi:hypothetical protein
MNRSILGSGALIISLFDDDRGRRMGLEGRVDADLQVQII